jgi:hypothetical protein
MTDKAQVKEYGGYTSDIAEQYMVGQLAGAE